MGVYICILLKLEYGTAFAVALVIFKSSFPTCVYCWLLQLKERISTEDDGHQAEKEGMKQQITGMTAELHKRQV